MTNKNLKELLKDLEAGLVSIQNEKNQNAFNVKMLRSQVETKSELVESRNKTIKRMQNIINEKNGIIGNLEFLLERKDQHLADFDKREAQKNEERENFEGFLINILDSEELTESEKIKLIREKI